MALGIDVGQSNPGFGTFNLHSRDVPSVGHDFSTLAARNNPPNANSTVNLFIVPSAEDLEWSGSVVSACEGRTVYALHCTRPQSYGEVPRDLCDPNVPPATVTVEPTLYIFSLATTTLTRETQVQITQLETCTLAGTTAATCAATLVGGAAGHSTTATSTSFTLTGTDYYRFDVAITAGAEKTAGPVPACESAAPNLSVRLVATSALAGALGLASFFAM